MDASNSGLAHGTSGSPQTTIENKEAEQKAIENEERIKAELEAKREAEEKAKREAEEKVKREAEEKAKREAEEKKKKEAEEQAKREAEEKAIREAITSKIWNKIEPTQEVYPGTDLPRSFNIETVQGQIWVHGHATKHLYEAIRFIKRRFHQDLYIFDISIIFDMVNDLQYELYLLLIKGLIIDKRRKCSHCAIMIKLCYFTHKQTKRRIAVFTLIVITVAELLCKHSFKLIIISLHKRLVMIKLVDNSIVLMLFNIAVDFLTVICKIICRSERLSFLVRYYRIIKFCEYLGLWMISTTKKLHKVSKLLAYHFHSKYTYIIPEGIILNILYKAYLLLDLRYS